MSHRYDAVVVGAGPNGLAAAVELARRHRSVLVVEGHDQIGGGCRTAELTVEGHLHDVCAAAHPLGAGSPYLRRLPLADYGLEWVQPEIPAAHPLEHTTVALHRSIADTAAGLGPDGDAYRELIGPLAARADALFDAILGPLVRMPRHPVTLARFGVSGVRSSHAIAGRFASAEAKALWTGLAAHSITNLDRPFTAAVALSLAVAAHAFGFPFVRGGSGSLVAALAAYFADLGGDIETGAWIDDLDELPDADVYLLDVSAPAAAAIAGPRLMRPARRRLRRWRPGPGVFKIDYALDGAVPWRDDTLAAAGTIHLGGTATEIEASEKAVAAGDHPAQPFVLVTQPSIVDDTRAPPGHHTLWAYCHVPNRSTRDMTAEVEAQIERFAPGFRRRVIGRHTMGNADYERYNPNNVGGDIAGGAFTTGQLVARPLPTPNPYRIGSGVYLCSSSAPPGAGVHGMSGYHAAIEADKVLSKR